MPSIMLLDNTVLSNFGQVNRPDILFDLWDAGLCTTNAVMAEYHDGISSNSLASKAWNNLPVLDLEPAEMTFTTQLPGCLGDGERSCLAIAIPRRGWIATDDRKARLIAIQYGIHVTGTIGVLYSAIENGILEKRLANTLLKNMISAGYRSPLNDLGQL